MLPRRLTLSLLALAATLVVVAGCSESPMSPVDGSMEQVQAGAPSSHDLNVDGDVAAEPSETVAAGVTSSKTIRGLLGGLVAAGDFTVIVPPLAITGTATITVTQPDVNAPVVDLDITPASANRFRLPVLLIAKASRMDRQLLSLAYISCYDPATDRWVRVPGCSISLLNLTVTAPLQHFSRYRVEAQGKAGW